MPFPAAGVSVLLRRGRRARLISDLPEQLPHSFSAKIVNLSDLAQRFARLVQIDQGLNFRFTPFSPLFDLSGFAYFFGLR